MSAGADGAERAGPCMVVGYDGSASARRAAGWAASSLPRRGRLVLVCSSRPLHAPASPLATAEERHRVARALFDELALEGRRELLDAIAGTEISDEDPVSALTHAAARHRASAIVVGHERHSRLHKAIGTVTSELLERSPVAVTVVPA
ncbi:MAG TPA: universal stress protein [Solirubrobacteraceae bacterium]|nr:universal stress protein [Solirubrobacteraceae bacterium]